MNILGINIGHDTSSALIKNGKVVAACEQERYNKKKHTNEFQKRFPEIRVCLIDGEMCSWYGNRMHNGLIYLNQKLSEWQMMQNLPKHQRNRTCTI